ncbi:tyrosine-protein kinase receptor-like [Discoglossus pictus]
MGFPLWVLFHIQMLLWTLLLVADCCSGLHAESILTPGLSITSPSMRDERTVLPTPVNPVGLSCDFETPCTWVSSTSKNGKPHWTRTSTGILPSEEQMQLLEFKPSSRDVNGTVLLLSSSNSSEKCLESQLRSPAFSGSHETCLLELVLYTQEESTLERFKVTVHDMSTNLSLELPPLSDVNVNKRSKWKRQTTVIGRRNEPFEISLDYMSCDLKTNELLILDSLNLINCVGDSKDSERSACVMESSFLCGDSHCISHQKVCDFNWDCQTGDDEGSVCGDMLPVGSHCSFEEGICGWTPNGTTGIQWVHSNSAQVKQVEPLLRPTIQATQEQV